MIPRDEYRDRASETRPPAERRRVQEKQALALVRRASRAPFYGRKFKAAGVRAGDLKNLDDFLRRVPMTRKQELMEAQAREPPFGGFLAVPESRISRVTISPGPIFEPRTRGERRRLIEAGVRGLWMTGLRPGDRLHIAYSFAPMPAGLGILELAEALGAAGVPVGTGETQRQVEFLRKLRSTAFAGTPSFFLKIGETAREMGLDPRRDFALRRSIHGAEPLPPDLRRSIEDLWGVETFDRYGVAEVGNIAGECRAHQGLHVSDSLLLELVDPGSGEPVAPGEKGEIVVSTLLSETMPLVRYRTGDLSILKPGFCPCGRTAPRLERILGRADMARKVRGVFVHPGQVATVLQARPGLGRFQIVIERPGTSDTLTVRIETPAPGEPLREEMARALRQALGLDARVELVAPGSLGEKVLEDRRQL